MDGDAVRTREVALQGQATERAFAHLPGAGDADQFAILGRELADEMALGVGDDDVVVEVMQRCFGPFIVAASAGPPSPVPPFAPLALTTVLILPSGETTRSALPPRSRM